MRHPAQDEIDELVGEYLYILAPNLLPGCPPSDAGYSILSTESTEPPPAREAGVEIGRYPVGMQGSVC